MAMETFDSGTQGDSKKCPGCGGTVAAGRSTCQNCDGKLAARVDALEETVVALAAARLAAFEAE